MSFTDWTGGGNSKPLWSRNSNGYDSMKQIHHTSKFYNDTKSSNKTSKAPVLIVLTVLCCGLLAFVWSIVLGVI